MTGACGFHPWHLLWAALVGYQHQQTARPPDCQIAGLPGGLLETWGARLLGAAGLLDCWTAGLLDCWTAGLLDCWTAGLLDCWTSRALQTCTARLLDC